MTHGVHDSVLPISSTSRRIVRQLRSDRYDVSYREAAFILAVERVAKAIEQRGIFP